MRERCVKGAGNGYCGDLGTRARLLALVLATVNAGFAAAGAGFAYWDSARRDCFGAGTGMTLNSTSGHDVVPTARRVMAVRQLKRRLSAVRRLVCGRLTIR